MFPDRSFTKLNKSWLNLDEEKVWFNSTPICFLCNFSTNRKFFWHQIITNGKYRSCEHRAITNPDRARLSVATFHDPAKTVKISPASELINESSPAKYRDVVYGDHVLSWYTKGPEGKRNIDALLLHS